MPHVLIIEDSYLFGEFVADAATLAGAGSIEVAESQGAAERAAARRTPDLIIADVRLRHGTGTAAVARIVAGGVAAPVLYLTAHPDGCRACPSGGRVIVKPVSHDQLRRTIAEAFAHRRAPADSRRHH